MRVKEEIIGKEVVDSSAVIIGKVKDVEVNFETQELVAFVVAKGGISEDLGISKSETIVPYEMVRIIGDKILLESTVETTQD
jgi:sporulation protein YlmC with PRC-barrel domain